MIGSFDVAKAAQFNSRNATRIGWYGTIPEPALTEFPSLRSDALGERPDRNAFAAAVFDYQLTHDLIADGMLGRGTWADLVKRFDYVDVNAEYFIVRGRRLELDRCPPYKLITFDEVGGIDLHAGGDFTPWKQKPGRRIRRILLHWGGVDAKSCKNALFNRDLSSHFGIELGVAFQWLDIGHHAWHASWGNTDTIGIDLCQQPTLKHLDGYVAKGYDVSKAINPARRPGGGVIGDREIVTLDSRTAATVRELCRDLCARFEIPYQLPRDPHGRGIHPLLTRDEFEAYEGILAHHHISKSKWDIAPWLGQIFEPGFVYEDAA